MNFEKWGRILSFFAALCLVGAPFFSFAKVPLPWLTVPVPGILLHGSLLFVCALVFLYCSLVKKPSNIALLLACLVSLTVLILDFHLVSTRTEYLLGKIQLSLVSFNALLVQVGMEPLDLMPDVLNQQSYLGAGLAVALLGTILGIASLVFRIVPEIQMGTKLLDIFFPGAKQCSCGANLDSTMHYCPQCAKQVSLLNVCSKCGSILQDDYKYCPNCAQIIEKIPDIAK